MQLSLRQYHQEVAACGRCIRLCHNHTQVAEQYPDYHAAPVGIWGDSSPRGLIVGLAPGLHGAARTGRAFVGDSSGVTLFGSLYRCGITSTPDPYKAHPNGYALTNVVKCLPPQNAPTTQERDACSDFLAWELNRLIGKHPRKPRVIVCLGGFAHRSVFKLLGEKAPKFEHAGLNQVLLNVWVVSSFHPSRLNMNTGRLTDSMLDDVFMRANSVLQTPSG
ncbi:MAG: uracil-DNA glycosylase family protein [Pseudomonadota bacterium]